MITKRIIYIFLFFIFTINTQANDKIILYLDWLNQFQFAGYYVAKEKGYFNDVGIDVDIKEFSYNSSILNDVMNNEATYGIGKSSLIVDKFNGNDLVLLSSIFQKSPMVLISLNDSNIKTPKDLKNKSIMVTDDAISSASINYMIASQGVKLNDINIQKHSFDLNDLINKKTDSMACFLSNEPYTLEKNNIPYTVLNPNEYNFDFYEGILYTSKQELTNNPNRVYNMNRASLKGWDYAFNHIEETAKLIYEKYNTQNKSIEALIYEGKILKQLSKIDEGCLGKIEPTKINEIKRFYSFLGLNNSNNSFETNSIILNKTNILLTDKQTKYLENKEITLLSRVDNTPFSFKINNKLNGIEIDIWNIISKALSKNVNVKESTANDYLEFSSNTINTKFIYSFEKKNKKGFLLSEPITQLPIALVTTDNKNFVPNLNNLKNTKIGVIKDLELISTLQKDYPDIKFVSINTIEDGITKLEDNQIFGLIDNLNTVEYKINKNFHSLKINSLLDYQLNLYLQVSEKNSEFISILNTIICGLQKEEVDTIFNNYQFVVYPQQTNYTLIFKIVIPLILLILIFIYFNLKMKKEIKKRKEIELELSEFANKDSLTNIYNRRKIEEIFNIELLRIQ